MRTHRAIAIASGLVSACACASEPHERSPLRDDPVLEQQAPDLAAGSNSIEEISETAEAGLGDQEDRVLYRDARKGTVLRPGQDVGRYLVSELQLNFVEAPAVDVARTVIGAALGEPVAVASAVDGNITLTSPEPLPVRQALGNLETVLAASGLTLIEGESGFLLTRLESAQQGSQTVPRGGVGYGLTVVRISNAVPSRLVSLVQPFTAKTVQVTPDDTRGLIMLRGPAPDVARVEEALRLFDTTELTDKVFGLFELRYTEAADVQSELLPLLRATAGSAAELVEVIPLPRLNQLFVLTRTDDQFEQVRSWIARLDRPASGDERRLYYYLVQNTPADTLASQLEAAFEGGGGLIRTAGEIPGRPEPIARAAPITPILDAERGISIVADVLNNALIVRATGSEYREIVNLIERMDVLPPQVLIEATIAEVTLNDELRFGIRYFFEDGKGAATLSDNAGGGVGPVFPGLTATYFDGTDAGIAIDLLASVTDVSVLSAPSIMVQNNQIASLQVGDEVPIVTQQAVAIVDPDAPIVSTVQLRETGVILEVKPRINASDMVVLEVQQEVSEVAPTRTEGINTPTIQQRQFQSTVNVLNGSTVALGGLIRETVTDSESGVPVLRQIPLAGNLFKSQNQARRRTELIVFLTPKIVRTPGEADEALLDLKRDLRNLTVLENYGTD
ncbi:type II secretion system secretin GspD [Parvularcula oceani]|uniref:type II secretion system secretin GspD n=1 Tax=Parvularcula oceani TaxID=1247963 RepID=UPI00138DE5FB|nr:type II secretion system secretin GspD [Parvularcula oceani]